MFSTIEYNIGGSDRMQLKDSLFEILRFWLLYVFAALNILFKIASFSTLYFEPPRNVHLFKIQKCVRSTCGVAYLLIFYVYLFIIYWVVDYFSFTDVFHAIWRCYKALYLQKQNKVMSSGKSYFENIHFFVILALNC